MFLLDLKKYLLDIVQRDHDVAFGLRRARKF